MEQQTSSSSSSSSIANRQQQQQQEEDDGVAVIQWEDFDQELSRFVSLSSALNDANRAKQSLHDKLHDHIQVEAESLSRSNELDEMREGLESRELVTGKLSMHPKVVKEKVKKQEEQLSTEIRSLLVAGTALSLATKRLQEVNKSLAGERGYASLKNLQEMLRVRQRHMVSQVSLLYPVRVVTGHAYEQELESFTRSNKSDADGYVVLKSNFSPVALLFSEELSGLKSRDQGSLTISGLHLSLLPFTKMSFFNDKKEVQRSATALGYVAHAVSLIACYLEVPLRYPLRMGGSRSYIRDCAPSIEPTTTDLTIPLTSTLKLIEFPLFLEGQDTTRAAYAVFLLNKDLEQLLNFIGVKSLGPRHVLANLKELYSTILSPEYIDT